MEEMNGGGSSESPTFHHPGFSGYIGVAREDITPPVGIYHRNWGAATHETAEGIHAPLTLTVMTFQAEAGDEPLVLAAADLGWWRDPKDEKEFRQSVLDALNLNPARFMLNFSHTHAGPVLCRDDADKPGGHFIGPYIDSLRDSVIGATQNALMSARRRVLEFAYGHCGLAANRDLPSPDGKGFVCGFNPHAPADGTLLLGRVSGVEHGDIEASLLNYACHPTTLAFENRLIAPDFVGMFRTLVEGDRAQIPYLFLQGASGELAPRDGYRTPKVGGVPVVSSSPFATGFADENGRILAMASEACRWNMLRAETGMRFDRVVESGAPLGIWETEYIPHLKTLNGVCIDVELPIKPEWRRETDEERQWAAAADAASLERLRRRRRIRLALGGGETAKMPVWIWQVGDAFFVGHPNEAYSHLQIELRAAFPDTAIVVMNITNGWFGYLPPADCYGTDRYSVWQTPFDRGSLEILIARCKQEIQKMRQG